MSPNDPQAQPVKDRLQAAWAALTPQQQSQIKPLFEAANDQHIALRTAGQVLAPAHDVPHNLMLIKSVITNDWDGLLTAAHATALAPVAPVVAPLAPVPPVIGPDGEIFGVKKFEQLDIGWIESVAVWLENLTEQISFPTGPIPVIAIPDNVTIGLAGDWGTGNWRDPANPSPSAKVGAAMRALKPNVTIHLGDVYYAGTDQQETDNLVSSWPAGSPDPSLTFTMNSNHEMYSLAKPLLNVALKSPLFSKQAGQTVFALENSNWVIVCLDSAFCSDRMKMFMAGNLNTVQLDFLKQQIAKNKKVIIVTHHNGFDDNTDGTHTANSFFTQVTGAFPVGKHPAYWYWGHVHTGVVYPADANGIRCRCAGHGAIPWGLSPALTKAKENGNVVWFETRNANDPDMPFRVLNGFTILSLKGADIIETFYDENGGKAWSSI